MTIDAKLLADKIEAHGVQLFGEHALTPSEKGLIVDALRLYVQEPVAWLEVGQKSGVVGVSLEKDPASPFEWEPLYRRCISHGDSR